ncbi:MFS family permease [Rhizobium sp. SG_E_25_P2]|uniref:MFS transporter n=1 Tax=Rhizobium sp. SG_E_25_P2 TaxID=2879942 RepID=UPI00247480E9|nr:MFS transporter [Rhizobium sp. SG_E_25_P2]MDH6269499.1 MFS family permease [Rhizobium sp. SG_E_25_P2]
MPQNLVSVMALLIGTLFLYLGNGLHSLVMPMRGTSEGYSETVLGFFGTSWAAGFVLGCIFARPLVKRMGHVRAFSGFISLIAIIALMTGIVINPTFWVLSRAATGFGTAATAMIIESWLNERASNESRGMIFSLYISITLIGIVGGQMTVAFVDIQTPILFMIAGIFYCVAMIPTLVSNAQSPAPLSEIKLDLAALYRNSPVSFIGILLVGIANGAWGTLGAVFGAKAGLSSGDIALMMTITIFAGAAMQMPAGRMSDRMDRRYVLAILSGIAWLAGVQIFLLEPQNVLTLLLLIAVYGATANALYPIAVAHANDFAKPSDFMNVSGGLLLLYGVGTVIGPTLGGPIMERFGPYALLGVTATAHALITVYAIIRSRLRAPIPVGERDSYQSISSGTQTTPESLALNPRSQLSSTTSEPTPPKPDSDAGVEAA